MPYEGSLLSNLVIECDGCGLSQQELTLAKVSKPRLRFAAIFLSAFRLRPIDPLRAGSYFLSACRSILHRTYPSAGSG
jgi:hypothetical protein